MVQSLAFVGKTGYLASAGSDGVAYQWDVRDALAKASSVPKELGQGVLGHGAITGQWSKRFPMPSPVASVAFAPDGGTLAVGIRDQVRLLAWPTGTLRANLTTDPGRVMGLTYAADGKALAVCGEYWDGKAKPVQLWDTTTNKQLWVGTHKGRGPLTLCFSRDQQTLYSAGTGVRRWKVATGTSLPPLSLDPAYATAVALSPDGKRLAVAGYSTEVLILDPDEPRGARVVTATKTPHDGQWHVYAVVYSPDGKWLATGARDGTIRLWDTTDYKQRCEWRAGLGDSRGVAFLAFAPRGDILAVAGGPIESGLLTHVELYETQAGKLLGRLWGTGPRVAWSPDGRWLATAEANAPTPEKHHVLLWDIPKLLGR
jgi:WD40 repeat protein